MISVTNNFWHFSRCVDRGGSPRQNACKATQTTVEQRRNIRCGYVSKHEARRMHDRDHHQTCNQENRLRQTKHSWVLLWRKLPKIGQSKNQRDGCSATRLTLEDDVTINQGLCKAIEAVRSDNCFLRASIPCTGGSPWQNINSKKLGGLERIRNTKGCLT